MPARLQRQVARGVDEACVASLDWVHVHCNQVERLWTRLKEWRAVDTRQEKTASFFMGVLCLAVTLTGSETNKP